MTLRRSKKKASKPNRKASREDPAGFLFAKDNSFANFFGILKAPVHPLFAPHTAKAKKNLTGLMISP